LVWMLISLKEPCVKSNVTLLGGGGAFKWWLLWDL
jgi:hypothetical protein